MILPRATRHSIRVSPFTDTERLTRALRTRTECPIPPMTTPLLYASPSSRSIGPMADFAPGKSRMGVGGALTPTTVCGASDKGVCLERNRELGHCRSMIGEDVPCGKRA